jgi:hypothetical protein
MWKGASRDVGIFLVPGRNPVCPTVFAFSKRGAKILFDRASFYRSPYHENMSHLPLHCDTFEVDSPHVTYR